MDKELIIDSRSSEVEIALLEEGQLVEIHQEKNNNSFGVGDIYLGRVRKIMPGLNAAFVDVGYERDAFLHYLDLGAQVRSLDKYTRQVLGGKKDSIDFPNFELENDIEKTGKISEVLKPNQQILVQVAKEPISSKGPRISTEISFAGRYIVLMPFSNKISVSQKIKSSDERKRLKRLISSIKPQNFGVIIRTVAEGKKVAELHADLSHLLERWDEIFSKLVKGKAPMKVVSELDRTSTILRDLLSESFNHVHVNDVVLAEEIKSFIGSFAPDKVNIVKLYKGTKPIFEQFNVDKQIKNSFGKIVTIKSGIYLIIEHTEALHVVDVNSGHRVNKEKSQEENALSVNLESATEIARQLRLRDMGGIIVIDFIDMAQAHNRRKLYQHLKDEMAKDRAKHTILPPSKFGLVQITRQRVRPEMNISILEQCPVCAGSGEIKPSSLLVDEIYNKVSYLVREQNEKGIRISVHPYVYAFLKKGLKSMQMKWYLEFKRWIKLDENASHHFLEYHFFNSSGEEIKL
ncbi:MAG: Rne/Rng family ribonuclease [Bacteroidales bacterium]|nr:Rne/Rng family ribonuclease [Bacteroidales bacterium]